MTTKKTSDDDDIQANGDDTSGILLAKKDKKLTIKPIFLIAGGLSVAILGVVISSSYLSGKQQDRLSFSQTDSPAPLKNKLSSNFEPGNDLSALKPLKRISVDDELSPAKPQIISDQAIIDPPTNDRSADTISIDAAKKGIDSIFSEILRRAEMIEKRNAELTQLLAQQKQENEEKIALKEAEARDKNKASTNLLMTSLQQKNKELSVALAKEDDLSRIILSKETEIGSLNKSLSLLEIAKNNLATENSELSDGNNDLRRANGTLNIQIADLRHMVKSHKLSVDADESIPIKAPVKVAIKSNVILTPKPIVEPKKIDSAADNSQKLQWVNVIAITEDTIAAIKDGVVSTIRVGEKWNGIRFLSIDTANGLVKTSFGDLHVSQ